MDNNDYQQPSFNTEPVISLGEWLVTLIISIIPCVGLIMLFVWAFGNGTSKTKQNYARAILVFTLIVIVLYVIILAVAGASIAAAFASANY